MKPSKLLILTPCVTIATIIPICSCQRPLDAEHVSHAIFDPADLDPSQPVQAPVIDDFVASLNTLNQEERENELIYSLFYIANVKNSELLSDTTLKGLYNDNKIAIQTKISTAKINVNDGVVIASFVGYVSFIFTQDYSDDYKINDYIMITYDFKNYPVDIYDWGMNYDDCIGFYKFRQQSGNKEFLKPIEQLRITTCTSIPHNSHNWGNI